MISVSCLFNPTPVLMKYQPDTLRSVRQEACNIAAALLAAGRPIKIRGPFGDVLAENSSHFFKVSVNRLPAPV